MSNVLRTKNGKIVDYLLSVSTPDYDQDPENLINPDISAVVEVPMKYWQLENGTVREMTPEEKQATDIAQRNEVLINIRNNVSNYVDAADLIEILVTIGNTQWSKGKVVTKAQFLDLLFDEISKRIQYG